MCLQNLLFGLFSQTLKEVVSEARKSGWYEGCVEDLTARRVKMESTQQVAVDASSGAETWYSVYVLDRGWKLEDVVDEMKGGEQEDEEIGEDDGEEVKGKEKVIENEKEMERGDEEEILQEGLGRRYLDRSRPCPSGFYISKRAIAGSHLPIYAARKFPSRKDPLGIMVIYRPNTGKTGQESTSSELWGRYDLVAPLRDVLSASAMREGGKEGVRTAELARLWDDFYNSSHTVSVCVLGGGGGGRGVIHISC